MRARDGGHRLNEEERFWSKVCKGCNKLEHNHSNGCWLWIAGRYSGKRYGAFFTTQTKEMPAYVVAAHRYALKLVLGVWPIENANHKCNQTMCVRVDPQHVYAGSQNDNIRDFHNKYRI